MFSNRSVYNLCVKNCKHSAKRAQFDKDIFEKKREPLLSPLFFHLPCNSNHISVEGGQFSLFNSIVELLHFPFQIHVTTLTSHTKTG